MDLETFIIAVFCLVDDFVRDLCHGRRLRQRGPAPILADSEVLTVEITGEFLRLDTDRGLPAYFRRHFGHLFPGLRTVRRTTFLRQAANLGAVKQALCSTSRPTRATILPSSSSTACRCRSAALPRRSAAAAFVASPRSAMTRWHTRPTTGCGYTCALPGQV